MPSKKEKIDFSDAAKANVLLPSGSSGIESAPTEGKGKGKGKGGRRKGGKGEEENLKSEQEGNWRDGASSQEFGRTISSTESRGRAGNDLPRSGTAQDFRGKQDDMDWGLARNSGPDISREPKKSFLGSLKGLLSQNAEDNKSAAVIKPISSFSSHEDAALRRTRTEEPNWRTQEPSRQSTRPPRPSRNENMNDNQRTGSILKPQNSDQKPPLPWRTEQKSAGTKLAPWARAEPERVCTPETEEQPARSKKIEKEETIAEEPSEKNEKPSEKLTTEKLEKTLEKTLEKFQKFFGEFCKPTKTKNVDLLIEKMRINIGEKGGFKSLLPLQTSVSVLLKSLVDLSEVDCVTVLKRLGPLFTFLAEEGTKHGIWRYKLHFLSLLQSEAGKLGFPRVSQEFSVLETVWLSLYEEGVVEKQYFEMWLEGDDCAQNIIPKGSDRLNLVMELEPFFDFLRSEELMQLEEEQVESEDEWADSEDDIEALIPQRSSAVA